MAKQKKKKPVHKNKATLPRKDRTVYEILLSVVFIISIILLRCYEYLFYCCASFFGTRDGYYFELHLTIFLVLMFLCLAAFALIAVFSFGELRNKGVTLKRLFDKKDKVARHFIRSIAAALVFVSLVFCVSFCVADSSKTVATKNNITSAYFTKDDEIIVDYNDVTEVKLFVERDRIARGKGMSSSRYTPAIKLYTDSGNTVLSASGFGFKYDKMNDYLKLFDDSKITVDDSDYELINRHTDAVKEMFNK